MAVDYINELSTSLLVLLKVSTRATIAIRFKVKKVFVVCMQYSLVGVNASKVAVESIMVSNKDFYLTLKKKGFEQDIRGLLPFGTIRHCIYSL